MNAQDIVLGQLERERASHDITRETLKTLQFELYLKRQEEIQQELALPRWKRKLLYWLRKDFK
jgi:hypothetical protein